MMREDMQQGLAELETLLRPQEPFRAEPPATRILAHAMQVLLLAASAGLGECRRETPYAPLRPVIDKHGNFKWCCNHHPEHCAP